ncbi:hypothetical protein [Cyanobium sp. LEGE 06113]|uniref:hypothetical protein n=1 Tax=Cyanobium sp. LEGE 06113 TaxID=1297573 RepID=UPI00351C6417
MRALFLLPGDSSRQLQAFPAVAAVADQLKAVVQVVCPAEAVGLWRLHPGVSRALPFSFANATLADWANLLGSVREPDFQLCINRAPSRAMDLMLSMSHIPTRVASQGFSATALVQEPAGGWPSQAWETWLRPLGLSLNAEASACRSPRPISRPPPPPCPPAMGPCCCRPRRGALATGHRNAGRSCPP